MKTFCFICITAIILSSCQVTRHVDSEDIDIVVSPLENLACE